MSTPRDSSDYADDALLLTDMKEKESRDGFLEVWSSFSSIQDRSMKILSCIGLAFLFFLLFVSLPLVAPSSPGSISWKSSSSLHASYPDQDGSSPSHTARLPKFDVSVLCNSSTPIPHFSPWSNLSLPQTRLELRDIIPKQGTVNINNFMKKTMFDMYCARAHLNKDQARDIFHVAMQRPEDLMMWNLQDLEFGKPTIYLTTATSPRSKSNPWRPAYFQRHVKQIQHWMRHKELFEGADNFQIVWIVVEDDNELDPIIARVLQVSGVPFVYFGYGPTNSWGNGQKNAAFEMAFALSRRLPTGIYGHGPVYGLDDDNFIMPHLFSMITTVERVGLFPVAFSDLKGGITNVEGPTYDKNGVIIGSTTPTCCRKFGFDYGAIAFNSSLLGTALSGPRFWDHFRFAGETEFLERIIDELQQAEPLCLKYKYGLDAECNYVVHNKPLLPAQKVLDDPVAASLQALLMPPQDPKKE